MAFSAVEYDVKDKTDSNKIFVSLEPLQMESVWLASPFPRE